MDSKVHQKIHCVMRLAVEDAKRHGLNVEETMLLAVFERAGDRRFFFGAGLPGSVAVDAVKISRSAASQC